ncbi:hypothetical protein Tco_0688473 [Tanacetum coccineum]
MSTLAEHIIVAGAENHPPMLVKSLYDSRASRIRLFIKGKKHGRMMLDSIDNGPLVYPTVEEDGQTRPKKYSNSLNHNNFKMTVIYPDPLALVANSQTLFNPSQSPQHAVPVMHPPPQQFTPVYAAPIYHQ